MSKSIAIKIGAESLVVVKYPDRKQAALVLRKGVSEYVLGYFKDHRREDLYNEFLSQFEGKIYGIR